MTDEKRKAQWRESSRRYRERHPDRVRTRRMPLEYHREKNKEWYLKNKEHKAAYSAEWAKNNRHKKNAYRNKRRATLKNQTPEMNKAELVEIEWMYLYNQIMPRDWDVDHIVALDNGGLHHPSNLQILSASDNRSKGSKLSGVCGI
jgi:5-methylcytosine-specific restriction endonuclease McrA